MSVLTRRTAVLTGCLSLAVACTAALTTALPAAATTGTEVTILSQSPYVDSSGYQHIVGEIQDTGTTNVDSPQLAFTFYDVNGTVLDSDFTLALADQLAPGEKAPFHEIFTPPAGYDRYTAAVSAPATTAVPNHFFTTAVTNQFTDAGGKHVVGTIRNDNTTSADNVQAVITLYDAQGIVVDSDVAPLSAPLAPGETASFEAAGFEGPAYASYAVLGQSTSPAAPATAPSPSPTVSPGSENTPTVAVSPSIISAGQRVTVTYRGAPNTTLDVWSKTQPATGYSKITTVTLDGSGYGTTSHAPRRNTRIMAKTVDGLSSTQPLIQVRSIASINAKRIGTRSYTFSGSVLPALNQRLVNLYRNGTLVAQTRTNASGVYTVTKTLARGTFGFQVRTPNDTYNLGTASASRTLTIY